MSEKIKVRSRHISGFWRRSVLGLLSIIAVASVLINCNSIKTTPTTNQQGNYSTAVQDQSGAPVVSPEESLKKMVVEEGFEVKLVAAEPLVSTPVAMSFDNKNRMWVAEMQGYMPNLEGTGDETPVGKIVILEDTNKDGAYDKRKVFLDSLVLPRALCLVENGILVAEPPRLWHFDIVKDKPVNKTLIDSAYTEGGNVEAQANGLYRALDNWIYSANSEKRFRKKDGKWLVERTHFRGQWGISQDDQGRLYYNNNSQNLLGDYFSPGFGAGNSNLQRVKGFNERIISDNSVYPLVPTPGVNRGYKENVLDSTMRLKALTASCGPVIYRGGLFKPEFHHNAFVPEPAANLIKRNVLEKKGFVSTGRPAYKGREFLASSDERFRPVTLYNGPDGALYVVDMYRGIIEYKLFLTEYLRKQIKERNLEKHLNCGRIYKVVPTGAQPKPVVIPDNPKKLVSLLTHANGWVRDRVQQTIIDRKLKQLAPSLQALLKAESEITVAHALWTLEGLGALQSADVLPLLKHGNQDVRIQALSVLPAVTNVQNYKHHVAALDALAKEKNPLIAPYIAFQMQSIRAIDPMQAQEMSVALARLYPEDAFVADALVSTVKNNEKEFSKAVASATPEKSILNQRLKKLIDEINSNLKNKDANLVRKQFPRGASLYTSSCQPCHGTDGNGVQSLAPPLNRSEWVTGSKDNLIKIVLYGLTGPVKVNGKVYKAPEINGDMPGIAANEDIVDGDVAQLVSFIRNAWANNGGPITLDEVVKIRKKFHGREKPFTVEELEKE